MTLLSTPEHLRNITLYGIFTGTYFGRWRWVRPSHGTPPGARPPVHVGGVSPRPGGRRGGRGRTGRGETAGRRRWPARVIVGHIHVGPVVHAHRQKGHRAFGGLRTVAAVAVHAERIARQHRSPVRHQRYADRRRGWVLISATHYRQTTASTTTWRHEDCGRPYTIVTAVTNNDGNGRRAVTGLIGDRGRLNASAIVVRRPTSARLWRRRRRRRRRRRQRNIPTRSARAAQGRARVYYYYYYFHLILHRHRTGGTLLRRSVSPPNRLSTSHLDPLITIMRWRFVVFHTHTTAHDDSRGPDRGFLRACDFREKNNSWPAKQQLTRDHQCTRKSWREVKKPANNARTLEVFCRRRRGAVKYIIYQYNVIYQYIVINLGDIVVHRFENLKYWDRFCAVFDRIVFTSPSNLQPVVLLSKWRQNN